MSERSAIDTIRGYLYQFDFSILSILRLPADSDSVMIEEIEDIDIKVASETTAIQCKYYEKTDYNHSVISEPVRLMLDHFKKSLDEGASEIRYKIRGHYKDGHSKLALPLTIEYLKNNFLTYSKRVKSGERMVMEKHFHHEEINIDDTQLTKFLSLLSIDIHAVEFETQYKSIITEIKTIFDCSDFIAENYFYNAALRIIRDLAKDPNNSNRTISKETFLTSINKSKILFNEWYIQLKGEKSYLSNLRKEYFGNINILHKERFFLIEIRAANYSRHDLKSVISTIFTKYAKIDKQPNPFAPYLYIHGIDSTELIEIKKDFTDNNIIIKDGFDFLGASFNPSSLVKAPTTSNQVKIKFINELTQLKDTITLTGRKSEIYQFYISDSFFAYNSSSIKEIKIQVDNIIKIKDII